MGDVFNAIYEAVKKIPEGKVASYGMIAKAAGIPRSARTVGWALHINPDPDNIKCHRVVTKDGGLSESFAFGGINRQRILLSEENIEFDESGNVLPCFFVNSL